MQPNSVCLFFYVKGKFFLHGCSIDEAEEYGEFLIYPGSHFDIWDRHYYRQLPVDFDYFPRGRVVYHKESETFRIMYDRCLEDVIKDFAEEYYGGEAVLELDEHYQCRKCNKGYVV